MSDYREAILKPSACWGLTDGDNLLDKFATKADGTWTTGESTYYWVTGTASNATSEGTLRDDTKNWTTNQWVRYQLKAPGQVATSGAPVTAAILSNTGTTITYYNGNSPYGHMVFNAGSQYKIFKVLESMDAPGACGKTDLLKVVDGDWVNVDYGNTRTRPHMVIEPSYCWNNTYQPATGSPVVLIFPTRALFGANAPRVGETFFNLGNGLSNPPSAVTAKYNAALNGVHIMEHLFIRIR